MACLEDFIENYMTVFQVLVNDFYLVAYLEEFIENSMTMYFRFLSMTFSWWQGPGGSMS